VKLLARISILLALLISSTVPGLAQGFRVESQSPPATAGAETFTSLEGRFSIALPQQISGYSPQSANTPEGHVEGSMFNWTTADGTFIVGYTDRPEVVESLGKRALDILRDNGIANAAAAVKGKAKLIGEKDISLSGHPGRELKVELSDGITTARIYLVGNRIYQAIVAIPTASQAQEAKAIKILDSFRLLTQAEVDAEWKKKIARATPSPLPQEPVIKRPKADAEEDGLKGKVKTVFTETEDLSGTWAVSRRKPSSMEYYNEQGNRIKRESYDYRGNPSDITVYGYLDGDRASHFESIDYEYNPPPMFAPAPAPGAEKPKYDPRYSHKLKYKYDEHGRLIEEFWYGNDGKLWLRYVYKYKGKQKETLVYAADGSLNQKHISTLDDKENEIEEVYYDIRDDSISEKYSYSYEFDARGNWVKRKTSKWTTKDGKAQFEPYSMTYRSITYY
jgi:hypothetical protein